MQTDKKIFVNYWEIAVPWAFKEENINYHERRKLRYDLQDYMHRAIDFHAYKDKTLIELGCGSGIDSAEFASNGAYVISIDFTKNATRLTLKTLKEANTIPNVIQADLHHLPLRDGIADAIYSFGVLHHIPDVENVMEEIHRISKEDAEAICMLYNKNSFLYAFSIIFLHRNESSDEEELLRKYSERIIGCPYTKAYTKEEAINLFSKYFNHVEAKVYYNVVDLPGKRKFKLNIPEDYEFGWHIIVKAKGKKFIGKKFIQ
jgi:ubiquinone/menaquinone biosynthesis C-methylase UbiE